MSVVEVCGLTKSYPGFCLKDACFALEPGRITGFIGRNGAGKSTTIKSMLNLVHPDAGEVRYFGMPLLGNEAAIKQRIGYSTGTVNWYPRSKIRDIVEITRHFYDSWDQEAYQRYLEWFNIDDNKAPRELSEGMKVKCNLLLALAHHAEVLILDEPTSGLDPFSRDELLDLFTQLKTHGVALFFSTHIISDIEKCADDIVYISRGSIKAASSKEAFISQLSQPEETLEQTFLRLEREIDHA